MKFVLTKNEALTQEQLHSIANIKSQHWLHPIESQKKWILKTYRKGDTHILMSDNNGDLIGYVALAELSVIADEEKVNALGISCLCVDKRHLGEGKALLVMDKALSFAKENKKVCCLLCKEKLVGFYEKCGCVSLQPSSVIVEGAPYIYEVMLNCDTVNADTEILRSAKNISIDRNF